jgi:hypothetical protein
MEPSSHQQRRVSAELLKATDLVVAMSTDHQAFLFETFHHQAALFNEVCHRRPEPLLDVWEAIPQRSADRLGADEGHAPIHSALHAGVDSSAACSITAIHVYAAVRQCFLTQSAQRHMSGDGSWHPGVNA